MPAPVVLLLLQLGCTAQGFTTSGGDRLAVWVCPPPAAEPAADGSGKVPSDTPA